MMLSSALRARNNFVNNTFIRCFSTSEKPLVTITGFEGYLGPYTALEFIKDGNFRVRGTIRTSTDEAKLASIKAAYG